MNLYAGRGVAVREYPLRWGSADYLLFVDREAVGVIEAKKEGVTLTGVELQADKYSEGVVRHEARTGRFKGAGHRHPP